MTGLELLIEEADLTILELNMVLPVAKANGNLEDWSRCYAIAYLIKIAAQR